MNVLLWGRAEYETGMIPSLPPSVRVTAIRDPKTDESTVPLETADVVVVPSVRPVTAAHVARLHRCRLVLTTTSGFDHVDVHALASAGIPVARLPLARRDAVVETATGMILALTRRFGLYAEGARGGAWERARLPEYDARRIGTVGVVGVGVIGRRMVEVLGALGARVLVNDPLVAGSTPLDELVATADVVTLHCELTPDTRGLFDAARVASMRRGAVLVNTARGKLVDAQAALAAVHAGHLGGLGLDVFPAEPADLSGFLHPRVVVSPHAAGWHERLGADIAEGVATAVNALLAGEPVPYTLGGLS